MIDFKELEARDFESLVGLLLQREGFEILRGPGAPGTRGPDFEVRLPGTGPILVEVKHFRLPLGRSQLVQFAGDLERYRQQTPHARGLLIASGYFSASARAAISDLHNLEVWDRAEVEARISKHADLEQLFEQRVHSQEAFKDQVEQLSKSSPSTSRSDELAASLRRIPCGKDGWKEYERVCTEILTHVFTPELATPDIQSRSDDGLDIIDAVFAIRSHEQHWALVRSEYRTRFVVAEFKNHCNPIGQAQVESISQYLWHRAHRNFGVLVSRHTPGTSAIAQRRRMWLEQDKCIVFLQDEDLIEMLTLRDAGGQPFDIIDTQLEDFLRTLTP